MFEDNKNFYPTPLHLINKMIDDVDFKEIKTVLEPSAGDGKIVEYLKTKEDRYSNIKINIDCIEIDETLQNILKGKEFRLIHNDFLTFNAYKKYDLIVANFPFSEGDQHLLKALQLQERMGGKLICLVNAETIKNPYSNDRKLIIEKLEKYNASIEYLQDQFIEAERITDVEIALIKVDISSDFQSLLLEDLKKSEIIKDEEFEENKIIDTNFINAIVTRYNLEIKMGLNLIKEYKKLSPYLLNSIKSDYARPILEITVNGESRYNENLFNDYIEAIRSKYWYALFNNNDFTKNLTSNLKYDLNKKVNELVNYDFSVFNIENIQKQMNQNLIIGIEKTILDLFDNFTYKYNYSGDFGNNVHYYNGWKSNSAYKINKKIILPINGFSSYSYDKNKLDNYYITEKIADMEKVFNYLEFTKERSPIAGILEAANNTQDFRNINFKYFTLTFFKKGTCHIVFNDDELLEKLNIFGLQRKGWLPPSYGKKQYNEMDQEEQQIINDFQGKETYNKVMLNKDKYIINNNQFLIN